MNRRQFLKSFIAALLHPALPALPALPPPLSAPPCHLSFLASWSGEAWSPLNQVWNIGDELECTYAGQQITVIVQAIDASSQAFERLTLACKGAAEAVQNCQLSIIN
jgi:hypothetical protein